MKVTERPIEQGLNHDTSHLDSAQKQICCGGGTERPFTGKYWDCKTTGTYECIVCRTPLFDSKAKYDSGSGWPSFWDESEPNRINRVEDLSHGMVRVEAQCSECGSHLGHVFTDGPEPTGLRYFINSSSLNLLPADSA